MDDITQPHYSGFLGFQEQLCSHYVVIVLNTVARSEFRIRPSGSGPGAESASSRIKWTLVFRISALMSHFCLGEPKPTDLRSDSLNFSWGEQLDVVECLLIR
ncbi:glutaredoxin-like protein C5orf63 homolog isoform 3-T7 [Hipposideros larvatus]